MSSTANGSSARLEPADLQRLRHLLGAACACVGVAGLFATDTLSPLSVALGLAGALAAILTPGVFAGRGERFTRRAGYAVFAWAAGDMALTLATDRRMFVASVVRAALLITALRCMQPRGRREDMQLILLSLFLAAVGGALSLSPVFAVQVFLFIPLSGATLFLVNLLEDTPETVPPDARWREFAWPSFARRVASATTWRAAAFFAAAPLFVAACGGVIFMALPRFRLDNAVPFLELPGGRGVTGVGDRMTVGAVSETGNDDSPALRADTPSRRRPEANPYWRMNVLDAFISGEEESVFVMSPSAEFTYGAGGGRGTDCRFDPTVFRPVRGLLPVGEWVVHPEPSLGRNAPLPGLPIRVRFDKPREWRRSEALRLVRFESASSLASHLQVQVAADSERIPARPEDAAALADVAAARVRGRHPWTLTELPADHASREALRAALAELGGAGRSPADFAARASAWLASRHAYALRDGYAVRRAPEGEPRDYLVRWMTSGATGWCEHFAGSFALLARAAGYPSRVVTGFSGGEWNEADRYLLVRMKNSHAWCEIHDRAAGVWLRADPTPVGSLGADGESPAGGRSGLRAFSGFAAWCDGVTMFWFRNVVNFEEEDRRRAFMNTLGVLSGLREAWEARLRAMREAFTGLDRREALRAATACSLIVAGGALAALVAGRWRRRTLADRLASGGADHPAALRYRRKASVWLRRWAGHRERGGEPPPEPLRRALERLRFGHPSGWGDPDATLEASARAWRRRQNVVYRTEGAKNLPAS